MGCEEELSEQDKKELEKIREKLPEITAELRAIFDPETVEEIRRTTIYLSSLTKSDVFEPIGIKYSQAIESVLSELRAVDKHKVHSGRWNPPESTRNEISTRNPGIYVFFKMDKKTEKGY